MGGRLSSVSVVYLAGAICGIDKAEASGWRIEASILFNKYGIASFSPADPYHGINPKDKAHAHFIDMVNRAAIRHADVVLCNLHDFGVGTAREIEYARSLGKPVYAFNCSRIGVMHYDVFVCDTLWEAIQRIVGLRDGEMLHG